MYAITPYNVSLPTLISSPIVTFPTGSTVFQNVAAYSPDDLGKPIHFRAALASSGRPTKWWEKLIDWMAGVTEDDYKKHADTRPKRRLSEESSLAGRSNSIWLAMAPGLEAPEESDYVLSQLSFSEEDAPVGGDMLDCLWKGTFEPGVRRMQGGLLDRPCGIPSEYSRIEGYFLTNNSQSPEVRLTLSSVNGSDFLSTDVFDLFQRVFVDRTEPTDPLFSPELDALVCRSSFDDRKVTRINYLGDRPDAMPEGFSRNTYVVTAPGLDTKLDRGGNSKEYARAGLRVVVPSKNGQDFDVKFLNCFWEEAVMPLIHMVEGGMVNHESQERAGFEYSVRFFDRQGDSSRPGHSPRYRLPVLELVVRNFTGDPLYRTVFDLFGSYIPERPPYFSPNDTGRLCHRKIADVSKGSDEGMSTFEIVMLSLFGVLVGTVVPIVLLRLKSKGADRESEGFQEVVERDHLDTDLEAGDGVDVGSDDSDDPDHA